MTDLGYLGRHQLGVEVPVALRTETAGGEPGWPDSPPVLTVLAADGTRALQRTMGADLQGDAPGTFRLGVYLGEDFAAGRYAVVARWADTAGEPRVAAGHLDVLPGGGADGAVISMAFHPRPDANYLVTQHDSGLLIRRRNPRV